MAAEAHQKSRLPRTDPLQRGGWITFPYIIGSLTCLSLATSGATFNLSVYLITKYNIGSIDAAQIAGVFNGCVSVAPVVGAAVADSVWSCFAVVAASTFLSFLGIILFVLTAALPSLRPVTCAPGADTCQAPSAAQLAVLYAALALTCVASGGTRFNITTLGAGQFDGAAERDSFLSWYFVATYVSSVVGATLIVYVQDSVSWTWGFAACAVAGAGSVAALLLGARRFRRPGPAVNPLIGLARVVVAAAAKWRATSGSPELPVEYYHGPCPPLLPPPPPTASFRWLNRAAVKTEGDTKADGAAARPWRLCTVQQVEDLKTVLRILPLWSTSIFLSITIGAQLTLTVLQALTVDRTLGPHFTVPAASLIVSNFAATAVSLLLLDRCAVPLWRRLTGGGDLTLLQRVGSGHLLNAVAMSASALVEERRIWMVKSHHLDELPGRVVVPMSVLWLFLPLVLVGVSEALHYPSQVALYYQEFPAPFRSSATGLMALVIALGFFLSTALIDLVRKTTDWLPDNLNHSKLGRLYWTLAVGGALNFGAFLLCAGAYSYQSSGEQTASRMAEEERSEP